MNICVYCSSSELIDPSFVLLAAEVGTELARRGHVLVSGGGSVSCMGAVARAARAGGAHTIGVIPEALVAMEVGDTDSDELIVTATMRERKAIMDERADGFLALPGGLGTLEELFEIWVGGLLGLHDKPMVILDHDGVFAHLRVLIDDLVGRGFVRPHARDTVIWATSVTEALDFVEGGVRGRGGPRRVPTSEEVAEGE
ncbi:hypothetical protein UG55_103127 [Frankia sp. EI5c]|uniref:LOG family protein n=1 Tax=Frankia sp. EI5c TaxID=683316 RepID=UPI0007C239FB|nr:TIGR00730 family Rossman fold protein [Frankia sp. EI5c]OAA24180.1 hypothetical protein UG55_103127 [Frankia sp. EI5c]